MRPRRPSSYAKGVFSTNEQEAGMWPLSLVGFALVAGFLAGHGIEATVDLVPLVLAIVLGFLALKATEQLYER